MTSSNRKQVRPCLPYQKDLPRSNNTITGTAEGFLSDVTETYDMDAATVKGLPTSSYSDWRLFSFLGRVNYNYADRYLLTASLRADGSSRYSKGNKWGYFPSANQSFSSDSNPQSCGGDY